jgi:hypothetical protein
VVMAGKCCGSGGGGGGAGVGGGGGRGRNGRILYVDKAGQYRLCTVWGGFHLSVYSQRAPGSPSIFV